MSDTGVLLRGRIRVTLVLLFALVSPDLVRAALATTTLSSLISSSQSIVRGHVVRVELGSDGSGTSVVKLKQVYWGWVPRGRFTIEWSRDPEEEHLDRVGEEYVFFLRRVGPEGVRFSQAGRRYWPLKRDHVSHRVVTPYIGLLTILVIDLPGLITKAQIRVPGVPHDRTPVEMDAIPLDLLVPAIKKAMGSAQKEGNGLSNRLQATVGGLGGDSGPRWACASRG